MTEENNVNQQEDVETQEEPNYDIEEEIGKEFNLSERIDILSNGDEVVFVEFIKEFIKGLKEHFNPKGAKKYYQNIIYTPKDIIEFINKRAGKDLI